MASREIPNKKNWKTPQYSLNLALKKEIALMREVLANLHQEELCLLEADLPRWFFIMEERSDFILQLQTQRNTRMDATAKLAKWAIEHEKTELLPADADLSCEIINKLDQVMALMERINLQNCRNDALFDQVQQKKELPLYCSYPHPLHTTKRKTSVATYTRKD